MKIVMGSDHAGFSAKNEIKEYLINLGYEIEDVGTYDEQSCDYPEFGSKAGRMVAQGKADFGIVICGTGIGISISANKVKGVRCGLCVNEFTAEMTRRHNNANVLALGARVTSVDDMKKIVTVFLNTPFEGGRHQRRVDKIAMIENDQL